MDCKYSKMLDDMQPLKDQLEACLSYGNQHSRLQQPLQLQSPVSPLPPQTLPQTRSPPILPIDDFHLLDNPSRYSEEEKQLRIKLTAVYRLIEINGWSMGIYNHVTVGV